MERFEPTTSYKRRKSASVSRLTGPKILIYGFSRWSVFGPEALLIPMYSQMQIGFSGDSQEAAALAATRLSWMCLIPP